METRIRQVMALGLTLLIVGCANDRSPRSNTTNPIGPTAGPAAGFTVSGEVTNAITGRPLPDASVILWPEAKWQSLAYRATSNGAGRYLIGGVVDSGRAWVFASRNNEFLQPCAKSVTLGDATVDLQLVAEADLFLFNLRPPPAAAGTRSVAGVIYRAGASGRRPVAGAWIGFEPIGDSPVALSKSDASGRYLLCGLPASERVELYSGMGAGGPGKFTSVILEPASGNLDMDIEIP